MGEMMLVLLPLLFNYLLVAVSETPNGDFVALKGLMDSWQNTPPNWIGSDPCDGWHGIKCSNSRVTSITLSSMNLTGPLSGDVGSLSELEILDLSYNTGLTGSLPQAIGNLKKLSTLILVGCGFHGSIPDEIGYLEELIYLSLNSNSFNGRIPPSIGNLSKLYWLDLADNQLNGPIPVSNGSIPGLDKLWHSKHFHLGKNKLSGIIPHQLFSSEMALIHVLFESNQLSGSIPSTLGVVSTLEVVRLDDNVLSGSIPQNLKNLTKLHDLFLSNNKLSGSQPNLTGMSSLNYQDMSNNSFNPSDFPPWFSTLESLTTLVMENTQLQGQIPASLFSIGNLQTLMLKDNRLNGTLAIGSTNINHLRRIDLEHNLIAEFKQVGVSDVKVILRDNPVCDETGTDKTYCSLLQPDISYTTPLKNCVLDTCSSDQIPSPNCKCAYPYMGTLTFRAPSFSDLGNTTYYVSLEESLMHSFQSHDLPVGSVSLSNPVKSQYLQLRLKVFPSNQDHFNRTGISSIGFLLSNQTFKPDKIFGPFYFDGEVYQHFGYNEEQGPMGSRKLANIIVIIGAVVGGALLLVLLFLAGVYAFCQKKRAERAIEQSRPFRRWDSRESNNSAPQLQGARAFSFEELQKSTECFSQDKEIGSGGYGKVYRGSLHNGQMIAIKRAHKESMQGVIQFKAEVELLSRVHHMNLVRLLGFCFEKGEQMLIYEYVPNGNLRDIILGKLGIRLDWVRRLKVALGASKGLAYLHELANPPIVHRDIKSANILLDQRMNAKVSDFGLSKLVDSEKDYITTQVKGTMGYLDPEYYMTQQLTEKSDVYSFGVVMLELITAKRPLQRGKYIVKEVRNAIDKTKDLCGLHEIVDPVIGLGSNKNGFEKFLDLTMNCVEESGIDRPTMSYVVREIENVLQQAVSNSNPNLESPTSSSCEYLSKGSSHHPYSNDSLDVNMVLPYPKIEPK